MSLNDKARAALRRELAKAFPERDANDPGHDRLAAALSGDGWSYTSTGNGAFITIHAPDDRTLLLQGDDARKFLDRDAETNDSFTIADLCASYADAFDAPHDRLAAALSDTGGMYAVRVKHDSGTTILRTYAKDAETAARVVCKVEGCPRSAILSIARTEGGAA